MNNMRIMNFMIGTYEKNFDAVFQLLTGDFEIPLCHPPTAALGMQVRLCRGACGEWPCLFECCSSKRCGQDYPEDGLVLTLLRAACMDAQLPDGSDTRNMQSAVLALLLLAGADDLEGAREVCGLCYETACNPVFYSDMERLPVAVLKACTVPAAKRAAAWPQVLRQLSKAEEGKERMKLAKTLFAELCCKDLSPSFFEELEAGDDPDDDARV